MARTAIELRVDASQAIEEIKQLQAAADASPATERDLRALMDANVGPLIESGPGVADGGVSVVKVRLAGIYRAYLHEVL